MFIEGQVSSEQRTVTRFDQAGVDHTQLKGVTHTLPLGHLWTSNNLTTLETHDINHTNPQTEKTIENISYVNVHGLI